MRANQFFKPTKVEDYPLVLNEVPIPIPGESQVLIRILYCGVCHTDLHIVEGDIKPSRIPIIPGHQVIGIIVSVGREVANIAVGERVGLPWLFDTCGTCKYCSTGLENLCSDARFTGFSVDGGFAEYVVAEADFVLPIPRNIPDEQAAPLLCAGIIGFRSLKKADVIPGEKLGLFGFGASAHITIQVAKYWGCDVFVFTRSPDHQKHALELGASWVGTGESVPPVDIDRAIIFAPAGWIVPLALGKIRPGGTLAINAIHMSPIPEIPYELIYGERTVRSVANATRQDGIDFLEIANKIQIKSTINIFNLSEANDALIAVKNSQINGEAVLKI